MTRARTINLLLVLISCLLAVATFEGVARLFVSPCENCWGELFGRQLPPFELITEDAFLEHDRDAWYRNLIVDGRRITAGDMLGIFREDSILGYAPKENAISANDWWQVNNVGARSRVDLDTAYSNARVLVFGESFTNGSRLRQEETWPYLLDQLDDRFAVVNFGVDGYSMGQSYLRYRVLSESIEHDTAVLVFVPTEDLFREVNTLRTLVGWDMPMVLPRFVVAGDSIRLVRAPYSSMTEMVMANSERVSPLLREHLRAYDSFYSASQYEDTRFGGKLVSGKLLARWKFIRMRRSLMRQALDIDSEPITIASALFARMRRDVSDKSRSFVLVIMPGARDLAKYRTDETFRHRWTRMRDRVCPDSLSCLDLMDDMVNVPAGQIDVGYDGTHYGPKAGAAIAETVHRRLGERLAVATPRSSHGGESPE
ncbi:MAG: hypothetical protein HKN37_17010 [Rhodothermales bacterium]|nr:hypothetical protein [Rhodothermales bacterium]